MADQRWYDEGSRPSILINWQTFVNEGIPNAWQGPFTDAVINAYTRWMTVAGVDLRFRFGGYTTKTSAGSGELLIKMNERHFDSTRLASTFGSYGRLEIVFHRKNGSNMTDWPFVPYNADPGEFDMQGILMHELGHCLGLDHSGDGNHTMFSGYGYHRTRYGPFEGDVARVKALYRDFDQNRLRQFRSTNGGASWSPTSTEITSYNHYQARTCLSPGVAAMDGSGLYVLSWSHPNRIPTWLRTDGSKFLMRQWWYYGGERSVQGQAMASDDRGTLLWAWVTNDDAMPLRVVRSMNFGRSWHGVNRPAGAASFGTPGLAWTRVGGQSTWILAWPHFDRGDHPNTGFIRASISTDDGWTWSAPTTLNSFYKVLSGVAVAADGANHVMVGLAWADNGGTWGINRIRTLRCAVVGSQLTHQSTMFPPDRTRLHPALAFDADGNRFVMAWREQNYVTSLDTATARWTDGSWSAASQIPNSSSNVAPTLAAAPQYPEVALWYAFEGP